MRFGYLTICVVLLANSCCGTNNNQDSYQYSKGPIPDHFRLGQSYPDRTEDQSCRPIQIHVERDTRRYNELVTYTKDNVLFDTDDSRKMTVRLHSQLSELADTYYSKYGVKLLVEKAWSEYPDDEVPETSLHYEGKRNSLRDSLTHGTRMHIYVQNYACVHKYIRVCLYVCTCIYVCMYVCMYILHVCIHVRMYVCVHV